MNKFQIFIFVGILAVFLGILGMTQESFFKSALFPTNPIPSLPPDGNMLQFLPKPSGSAPQQQQQAQQQEQAQQQQVAGVGTEMGPPAASVSAIVKTTKGTIVISLVHADAPHAIDNFLAKAKSGFYNGLTFHRVEDWVIQGGDPTGTGNGGSATQTELNGKPFNAGSVGWAASQQMQVGQGIRISNDSQFFIVKQDAPWLTAQYSNFGTVVDGMAVVNKIGIGDKILGITLSTNE